MGVKIKRVEYVKLPLQYPDLTSFVLFICALCIVFYHNYNAYVLMERRL
jgi:hypothetical protein